MTQFCWSMATWFHKHNIIGEEDINPLRFAFELILTQIMTYLTMLMIGIIYHRFYETIVYCFLFGILRKRIQGYHAQTFRMCFVLTNLNYLIILFLIKYNFPYYILNLIVFIFSFIFFKGQEKILIFNLSVLYLLLVAVVYYNQWMYLANMCVLIYTSVIVMRLLGDWIMKIAVVDDQKDFLKIVGKAISHMNYDIHSFTSVFEMEKTGIQFDLVLLDIEMPDCDGIAYAKEHRELKIIFITSQSQRMKEAFGNNVYGFIEKTDSLEKYVEVIERIINEMKSQYYITLKTNNKNQDYHVQDIIYLQYFPYKNISFVYQGEIVLIKGYTLKEIEPQLNDQFVYIDRGTMVNKDMLIELIHDKLYIRGIPQTLKVSARRKQEIKLLINLKK